jgi:hypothetical protein
MGFLFHEAQVQSTGASTVDTSRWHAEGKMGSDPKVCKAYLIIDGRRRVNSTR